MKLKILVFLILLTTFYLLPTISLAVDYIPLVPCGLKAQPVDSSGNRIGDPGIDYTRSCTRCDAFKLAENVIDFGLKGIVPPVAAVLFVTGGLVILLSGAKPEWITFGKKIFWNTFIGLLIILASWLIVNTFIQSFGPDQVKGSWFKLTCRDSVITGPGGIGASCSNPGPLAEQNNTVFPKKNAPELDELIRCVNSKLGSFIDQDKIYTYEKRNELCNYTRGQTVCGACAHRINSCHYGGPNGSNGSLAVDFNAQEGTSEQDLFNRLSALRNVCNFGFILFENNHTHISTKTCAGDTGGD